MPQNKINCFNKSYEIKMFLPLTFFTISEKISEMFDLKCLLYVFTVVQQWIIIKRKITLIIN